MKKNDIELLQLEARKASRLQSLQPKRYWVPKAYCLKDYEIPAFATNPFCSQKQQRDIQELKQFNRSNKFLLYRNIWRADSDLEERISRSRHYTYKNLRNVNLESGKYIEKITPNQLAETIHLPRTQNYISVSKKANSGVLSLWQMNRLLQGSDGNTKKNIQKRKESLEKIKKPGDYLTHWCVHKNRNRKHRGLKEKIHSCSALHKKHIISRELWTPNYFTPPNRRSYLGRSEIHSATARKYT